MHLGMIVIDVQIYLYLRLKELLHLFNLHFEFSFYKSTFSLEFISVNQLNFECWRLEIKEARIVPTSNFNSKCSISFRFKVVSDNSSKTNLIITSKKVA